MYVNLSSQNKFNSSSFGSCSDFVMYLEKENALMDVNEKEYFFNQHSDEISSFNVIHSIDTNKKGLKDNEAKFYTLLLSPDQKELAHIHSNKAHLKDYVKDVMNSYAKGFNAKIDGRELSGDDLVWFAKLESERQYSRFDKKVVHNKKIDTLLMKLDRSPKDKKVRNQLQELGNYLYTPSGRKIKAGLQKEGAQQHIHVLISRKDKSQKISLSPMANAKKANAKMTRYMLDGKIIPKTKALQLTLSDFGVSVQKNKHTKKMTYFKDGKQLSKEKANQLFKDNGALMKKKGITKELQNARVGFNRDEFCKNCENIFDYKFDYERKLTNSYEYNYLRKKDYNTYLNRLSQTAKHYTQHKIKNKVLTLGDAVFSPAKAKTKVNQTLNMMKKPPVTPIQLGIKVVKKTVGKIITAGLSI